MDFTQNFLHSPKKLEVIKLKKVFLYLYPIEEYNPLSYKQHTLNKAQKYGEEFIWKKLNYHKLMMKI